MTTNICPKNMTPLERRIYATIKIRAKFVDITIDDLCHRSGIAPSTFSRWVNGHNSGYISTVGKMDAILTDLETAKFRNIELRIRELGLTLSDACRNIQVPILDYTRWVGRKLDPDYSKLAELERFLNTLSANQLKKENNND